MLFGGCRTAQLVADGKVGSSHDAEWWHADCQGANIAGGRVHLCNCHCHTDHPRCFKCGDDSGPFLEDRSCVDTEGCLERYRDALATNPRTAKWEAIHAAAAEAKAEADAEEKRAVAAGERQPRRAAKAPKPCAHCGEPTKGGTFVMGHDAKLKGILMRAGGDGDVESIVELALRGWLPTAGKGTDRYSAPDLARADERVHETTTEAFLAARVAERLALVADGVDPEAAVRQIGGLDG
jgi:hypothetical protein